MNGQLPLTVDWRNKGIVPPVGKQGDCASGWAFAAADALSSAYNIQYDKAFETSSIFSKQELISCDSGTSYYHNDGCNGGSAY